MASITSWTRLEPRVRRGEPSAGLEARIRDPLWLLARQWQVGEFAAEDAGSPLQVRARVERAPLTRFLPGTPPELGAAGLPYDAARVPLDLLVEREAPHMDRRLACEAGLHFLRLLALRGVPKYRDSYLAAYPLTPLADQTPRDDETVRLLRVSAGRVPDGARLAGDLRASPGSLPDNPAIDDGDRERVRRIAAEWLAWLDGVDGGAGTTESAWNPERMEYAFSVAAPASSGERVFVAPEHAQGPIDWNSFDRRTDGALGAQADAGAREVLVRTAIPAPVGYRGMPVARWWEFEDGQVNFGTVDAGPTDLLRLLLLGFALDYGNDWFVIPVELQAGAICRVTSLVVTDSFGERTLVRPYTSVDTAGTRWRMFCVSADAADGNADDDALLLPSSIPAWLQGDPIEQVVLVRDEVANLAWAVERLVEEAGGRPLDRFEQYQAARHDAPPAPVAEAGDLHYRLSTTVPDYWVPLVPTRIDPAKPDVRLVRGRVLLDGATTAVTPVPLGRLLEPGHPLRIFEEEVSRSGARLERRYRYARWTDGSAHCWVGRRKGVGRGEGASGLRFDSLSHGPTAG